MSLTQLFQLPFANVGLSQNNKICRKYDEVSRDNTQILSKHETMLNSMIYLRIIFLEII